MCKQAVEELEKSDMRISIQYGARREDHNVEGSGGQFQAEVPSETVEDIPVAVPVSTTTYRAVVHRLWKVLKVC
jgi:hypothetical protein